MPVAAAIIRRLDAALATMEARKMKPRAIYLDAPDYTALAKAKTKRYRADTGSTAFLHPLSYRDILIINEKLIAAVATAETPVRPSKGLRSIIYSTHGVGVCVPKRAPCHG